MLSYFVSVGILWFLLVFFNEESDHETQQQAAFTISLVITLVGVFVHVVVRPLLPPELGFVTLLLQVLVLYLAVKKCCGYSSGTVGKIVASYFVLLLIAGMVTRSLT